MAKRSNIPGAAPASKRARTGVRLLRGVLAGLLAAALGLAGVCAMLPAQTAYDPARLYDYVYSGTKSQSVPFTTASMSDDGHLAFGSSEFFISKDKVAQCPQAVLDVYKRQVYDIPTACVLVTCFVAIPFVLAKTLRGPGKDYRLAGYAALCAIALLPTMLSSTFRLEPPEETYLGGGAIEVVTPEWFDTPRVEYATSEGPLFMSCLLYTSRCV